MNHSDHVFRTYDIRGVVDRDFDAAWVERLGRACAAYFLARGQDCAVLAHDCRLSSPALLEALRQGLSESGVDCACIGAAPTPALYFAVKELNKAAGVMITASHNPPQYNGFKIWSGASTLYGEEIQELRRVFAAGNFPKGRGLVSHVDVMPAYVEDICSRLTLKRPMKVVVDGGNGSGGPCCVAALARLGAEVVPLYCEPDGRFPNHHPDPTVEANMQDLIAAVRAEGAEVGFGLDGDGDRLGVVDACGRLLAGDEILAVYAHELLERRPGSRIIGDVKCSGRLFADLRARGGEPEMWITGHSLIKARMRETGALLAGELSGHMFFADGWHGFDDAIYGAARMLAVLGAGNVPLTELPGWPPAFTTREIQIPCPEQSKAAVIRRTQDHFAQRRPVNRLDGARVSFEHGWGLVRASNTQPVLVLRFEADSQEALDAIRAEMEGTLRSWLEEA
ncbi:MAG: phosphomannomutase/phosphoglucomutase [Deltaproteobacteria bacterium]|jgi:phosphomannomutase/phosphoglucomutase|nr:phosphomannomutase/phosphoglucomutase [Deltaproteobacteria bacterium]